MIHLFLLARSFRLFLFFCIGVVFLPIIAAANNSHVAVIDMDMMILPGTQAYLEKSIDRAASSGAELLVVKLDTPGGMLNTSQEMIQIIFKAPIPVIMYVGPGGATATSAGVFITLAGHIAAMAPGTSIGAAHPVSGDGKDIEGDMREKVEQMTMAMVRSVAEQRGRNVEWAEKAVKESSSITEKEALDLKVIDLIAEDIPALLKQLKGFKIKVDNQEVELEDYSNLPVQEYEISVTDQAVNVLANPNIAALLWLGATAGISLEIYNPGSIIPGVVGVICLILALAVSQIIPINQGGLLLLIVGALLITAEFYVTSGILGFGGIVAIVLGALWLVDVAQAPNLQVSLEVIMPVALIIGGMMLWIVSSGARALKRQSSTGNEGLIGMTGIVTKNVSASGKVFVNGEYWNATSSSGLIEKGAEVRIIRVQEGLVLEVEPLTVKEQA